MQIHKYKGQTKPPKRWKFCWILPFLEAVEQSTYVTEKTVQHIHINLHITNIYEQGIKFPRADFSLTDLYRGQSHEHKQRTKEDVVFPRIYVRTFGNETRKF